MTTVANLRYKIVEDVDFSELKCVLEYTNESKTTLSVALEPWACAVRLFERDCLRVFLPTQSGEPIEFVEDEENERLIGTLADQMIVELNGRTIANFPTKHPEPD